MDLANDFVSQFVKGLDNFLLIEAAGSHVETPVGVFWVDSPYASNKNWK
jgi:hypothetical protein